MENLEEIKLFVIDTLMGWNISIAKVSTAKKNNQILICLAVPELGIAYINSNPFLDAESHSK